jgi:16S rRNA (uracil1498-N3)-methyltransferase
MQLFYSPVINTEYFTLDHEESRHCVKVMRLRQGDEVFLTDGMGGWYKAEIADTNPKACILHINEKQYIPNPRSCRLHMAVAPTKNIDRFEWFLEKASECGIDEITPVICDHSERTIVKAARLEKVMISAMKQSLRAWLPKLNPAITLESFFKKKLCPNQFIAHCAESNKKPFQTIYKKGEDALVLIGPEGDFSPQEIEQATTKGFQPISLGNYRLRTETAALTVCISFNMLNGY